MELVNSLSYYQTSIDAMRIYDFVLYDTIHVVGNSVAVYEYCRLYRVLMFFANFLPEYYTDWFSFDFGGAA
jgi:hypothetical protein